MRRLGTTLAAAFLIAGVIAGPAAGANPAQVFTDQATFTSETQATPIAWPSSANTALPSKPFAAYLVDYSCAQPTITLSGGAVTVTNPTGNWICFVGSGWNAGLVNTNPTPTGPTIIGNGEDDYSVVLTFAQPQYAVGFGLLTNSSASETVTLYFADGTNQVLADGQLGTSPNSFEFIGFKSNTPITSVALNTTGGASQNEGITGIWRAGDIVPTGRIVSPATGGTYQIGNVLPIEANYYDDNPGSALFWAVRVDENTSCSNVGDNQVWANVDGDHDPYTWLSIAGGKQLLSTAPTVGWAAGDYCFVFNPGTLDSVPAGEYDVRLVSRFTMVDTANPVITFVSALPEPNVDGWNNSAVELTWSCTDTGSGVVAATVTKTIATEGADQSATGTCTDKAGNTASDMQSGFDIDKTAPGITWNGGIAGGDSFFFGSVPAAPTCDATDALSGPKPCQVEGYSDAIGSHTLTATAHDVAGNAAVETRAYTVGAWTLTGFYRPVEMDGIWNVIKSGQTVPLKFEVFAGDAELTDTAVVKSFTATKVACPNSSAVTEEEIDFATTGSTSLRYDATGGQFVQNWQTPKTSGVCYRATMTTDDGSSLAAFFRTK